MRAFIALELPLDFADETAALARALQAAVPGRFMKRDTYHITLAFLGDIDQADAARAMDALDAVAGHAPVPLAPEGLGSFKQHGNTTLYLAIARTPEAQELAASLREELRARGISFDDKKFLPHVTLARRAQMPGANLAALPFPYPATAANVTLFKSELSHEGATYKPLYTVQLRES